MAFFGGPHSSWSLESGFDRHFKSDQSKPIIFTASAKPAIKSKRPMRHNRVLTAEERSSLLVMIDRDAKMLESLRQSMIQQLEITSRGQAKIEGCQALLVMAKARYEAATTLHRSLEESMRSIRSSSQTAADILSSNDLVPSPHLSAISETLQVKDQALDQLSAACIKSFESVEKGREALVMAEEEFQGALAVASRNEEEIRHLDEQIASFHDSIARKRLPFRSIFRLPADVWEMIFEDVVRGDAENIPLSISSFSKRKHGCTALGLSSVCYTWRVMSQSFPSLWRYIFIPLDSQFVASLPRIRHYIKLCKTRPPVVSIQARSGNVDVGTPEPLFPMNVFPNLESLYCTVSENAFGSLSSLLKSFPPPIELSLQRESHIRGVGIISALLPLPRHFLSALKIFNQINVSIHWGSIWGIQEDIKACGVEEYRLSCHSGSIPSWLCSSPHRLRRLTLDLSALVTRSNLNFPALEELRAPLHILLGSLTQYSFPTLKKIIVSGTSACADDTNFEEGLSSINVGNIREVVLESMDYRDVPGILIFLSRFSNLETLELDGNTVDPIVNHLDVPVAHPVALKPLFMSKLAIRSYLGRGDALLLFVKRRMDAINQAPSVQEMAESEEKDRTSYSMCPALREIEIFSGSNFVDLGMYAEMNRILSLSLISEEPVVNSEKSEANA